MCEEGIYGETDMNKCADCGGDVSFVGRKLCNKCRKVVCHLCEWNIAGSRLAYCKGCAHKEIGHTAPEKG